MIQNAVIRLAGTMNAEGDGTASLRVRSKTQAFAEMMQSAETAGPAWLSLGERLVPMSAVNWCLRLKIGAGAVLLSGSHG